jgi:hypothetical protein
LPDGVPTIEIENVVKAVFRIVVEGIDADPVSNGELKVLGEER